VQKQHLTTEMNAKHVLRLVLNVPPILFAYPAILLKLGLLFLHANVAMEPMMMDLHVQHVLRSVFIASLRMFVYLA